MTLTDKDIEEFTTFVMETCRGRECNAILQWVQAKKQQKDRAAAEGPRLVQPDKEAG